MCTQDIIVYRCDHAKRGELHPCADKQEYPDMSCTWEVVRRLRLHQKCKKCVTEMVYKRSDSDWCYANNEEYQKKVGNMKEERAKRDILPDIARNFASIKKAMDEIQVLENKKTISDIQAIDSKLAFDGKQQQDTNDKHQNKWPLPNRALACTIIRNNHCFNRELARAKVQQPYYSNREEDCCFREGDEIAIFGILDNCWCWGENLKPRKMGKVPSTHLEVIYDSVSAPERSKLPSYDEDIEELCNCVNGEVGEEKKE